MSTKYELFLDEVLPHVPGCSVELALLAIKNSVIEFCEKSLILQRDADPVTVLANVSDYDLDADTGYKVVKVMKAWYKNTELQPIAPDEIVSPSAYNPNVVGSTASSQPPTRIYQKDDVTFSLYPAPPERVVGAVTMRVALKPTRSSTEIEDVIYEDYAEAIGYGAKYRLMGTPAKPFTNPQAAGSSLAMFMQLVNSARQKAVRGYVRSSMSVQMRKV